MRWLEMIKTHSPWIFDPHWAKNDRNIKKVKNSGITFRHFENNPSFKAGSVNILRGPRQVGKTTELKLIIQDFLKNNFNPNSIIYYPCDNILNRRELMELVLLISDYFDNEKIVQGYIFLDEITTIKDWHKTIKGLVDSDKLSKHSLLITSSSSIEIKRGYERMPGRRRGGFDKVILPMNFYNFTQCFNMKNKRFDLFEIISDKDKFNKFKIECFLNESKYIRLFELYSQYGGFPFVVSELVLSNKITDETEEIISSIIFSEIEKQKLNINTAKSILIKTAQSMTTPISYNNIASDADIYSAEGAKKYTDVLCSSFINFMVRSLNLKTKRAFPKKNIKIYFSDVIFLHEIKKYHFDLLMPIPKTAELLTGIHLLSLFSEEWAKYGGIDNLFFWQSKNKNEIDFVIFKDNKPFGIEVKYQNTISGWDEMSIQKGLGQGILITKKDFTHGRIPKIPIWAFLLTAVKK